MKKARITLLTTPEIDMPHIGKWLMSLVALWSTIGSYFFDWNATHIYNPNWPPHAKFHNAQAMLLGTALGLLSLALLWIGRGDDRRRCYSAGVLASLYWITQAGAILFPGTALADPEFTHPGDAPVQLIVDAVMLGILSIGLLMERSRLSRTAAANQAALLG